jgi:hypothetical protein
MRVKCAHEEGRRPGRTSDNSLGIPKPVAMVLREGTQLGEAHEGHTSALHGDQGRQDPGLKVWQALAIQQSE